MPFPEHHLSDQELLLAIDGELSERDFKCAQAHLTACWACRTRKQEIEGTIGEFIRTHRRSFEIRIPPPEGPRALLKARLAQVDKTRPTFWLGRLRIISWTPSWAILAAVCGLGAMAYFISHTWEGRQTDRTVAISVPDPSFTPGATLLVSRDDVCRSSNTKNKAIPVALRRRVFDEYGIPSAEPSAYEVDYLITPALGGADDIHNLWPQSNRATIWNAPVKDELEDRLRDLVCDGQLDLATAQREIATNWIQAYKKYFHTDRPLPSLQ